MTEQTFHFCCYLTKEVEAESVAYAVCQYYGIETAETSAAAGFGYGILRGIHMKLLDEKYLECAMRAVDGVMDQIRDDGTVEGVSNGTGMGRTLDHYREIHICPMAYGQSLTALMLCEVMA